MSKVLGIGVPSNTRVNVEEKQLEYVELLCNIGSIIDNDGEIEAKNDVQGWKKTDMNFACKQYNLESGEPERYLTQRLKLKHEVSPVVWA